MTNPLATHVRILAELRERLKAQYELEDGDEALEDTLEGCSDLPEMLASMVRKAKRAEAYADGMKAIIAQNQARKVRLEQQAETLRRQVAWAMEESGLKKLPLPDMTVTLSEGKPPLMIPNDADVPDYLCRIKTIREPDKPIIRRWIETNGSQSFAFLGNAQPILTVRTK